MSFILVSVESAVTPLGKPYVQIVAKDSDGNNVRVYAHKPEKIATAMSIPADRPFRMTWQERNGLRFLTSIEEVENGDQP